MNTLSEIAMSALILATVVLLGSTSAFALGEKAQLKLGETEYRGQCAACHGVDAKGNGPVAEVLSTKPTDLTQISKKFDGKFPRKHIYQVIDGRQKIRPHGDTEMPVWGHQYRMRAEKRADEVPQHEVDRRALVHGRIVSLIQYLESIQAE